MEPSEDDLDYHDFTDAYASRAEAYRALILTLDNMRSDRLRKEGLAMLQTLRATIATPPRGELRSLPNLPAKNVK